MSRHTHSTSTRILNQLLVTLSTLALAVTAWPALLHAQTSPEASPPSVESSQRTGQGPRDGRRAGDGTRARDGERIRDGASRHGGERVRDGRRAPGGERPQGGGPRQR
jgi:hypothetical protein